MLTDLKLPFRKRPELWGGIECTINRVHDDYYDQLELNGHYKRKNDISLIAELGVKALRYPVLWERHQKQKNQRIDFTWIKNQLDEIRNLNIIPIAGLVHHGSGPAFTSLDDSAFSEGLASYAGKLAAEFPWIDHYTPVNEPLTTSRFSGLYGFWYPHHQNDHSFLIMLLNQLRATVLSMKEIRKINPQAKLIQTEDLAKIHSTPLLKYQADFENERRWLTYDILCGKLNRQHPLWDYMISSGIKESELFFFTDNPCPPDILGLNYYVTSERYLDENIPLYPYNENGGNGIHRYADIEMVRALPGEMMGVENLIMEAWKRYQLPIAITEVHLNCTREQQMRWFNEIWEASCHSVFNGVDLRAVTAWSALGAYNWSSLLTKQEDEYESGVFDLSNTVCRPTALAKLLKGISKNGRYDHPLLQQDGWWKNLQQSPAAVDINSSLPILILGKTGTLGATFIRVCESRNISYRALSRGELNIVDEKSIISAINHFQPWAIINATGYVQVDNAETDEEECFSINAIGPGLLAGICKQYGIRFLSFSSDLVFDGQKASPYLEDDMVYPLNVYGRSKAEGEKQIAEICSDALIIRTSAFFGPWDKHNFVHHILDSLKQNQQCSVADDILVSPTYTPDLANAALNLLIDEESGIWHLSNRGIITWAQFAEEVAARAGFNEDLLLIKNSGDMEWVAKRPKNSVLNSTKGHLLPSLENALERYFRDTVY